MQKLSELVKVDKNNHLYDRFTIQFKDDFVAIIRPIHTYTVFSNSMANTVFDEFPNLGIIDLELEGCSVTFYSWN